MFPVWFGEHRKYNYLSDEDHWYTWDDRLWFKNAWPDFIRIFDANGNLLTSDSLDNTPRLKERRNIEGIYDKGVQSYQLSLDRQAERQSVIQEQQERKNQAELEARAEEQRKWKAAQREKDKEAKQVLRGFRK